MSDHLTFSSVYCPFGQNASHHLRLDFRHTQPLQGLPAVGCRVPDARGFSAPHLRSLGQRHQPGWLQIFLVFLFEPTVTLDSNKALTYSTQGLFRTCMWGLVLNSFTFTIMKLSASSWILLSICKYWTSVRNVWLGTDESVVKWPRFAKVHKLQNCKIHPLGHFWTTCSQEKAGIVINPFDLWGLRGGH